MVQLPQPSWPSRPAWPRLPRRVSRERSKILCSEPPILLPNEILLPIGVMPTGRSATADEAKQVRP
jgi:hypothetical protein